MLLINNNKYGIIGSYIFVIALLLALSCGGGGESDPQPSSGKGKVAFFITDNISFYKQVVSTITGVRLVNSGTGGVCEVMTDPLTLDIANLTNLAHYASLAECADGKYNRIDIDFRKIVVLMDQLDATSVCAYTSYLNDSGVMNPMRWPVSSSAAINSPTLASICDTNPP